MLDRLGLAAAGMVLAGSIALVMPARAHQEPQRSSKSNAKVATGAMVVATCTKPAKHGRRIGWGKYGLQYDVPKLGVKILGGKPDVDYVKYVIRTKGSKGWLTLWFGPYAMSSKPSEELITGSSELSQRSVLTHDGALAGLDTSGVLKTGEHWRQTSFIGSGSLYQASSPSDVALFDGIVNSMCEVPYP